MTKPVKKEVHSKVNAIRPNTISDSITLFTKQLKSLYKALPPTMNTLGHSLSIHAKKVDTFVEKHAKYRKEEGSRVTFKLTAEDITQFSRLAAEADSYALAIRNVPITFLVALISQYDAYLGNLLRTIFYLKLDMLNASQKQFTYSELVAFPSLDAAKDHIIEKEVESVLRTSHAEHFDWMETRFCLPLRKDLTIWPQFIELTERRNLFVHGDGIVSNQYLTVCAKHVALGDKPPAIGTALDVSPEYFSGAYVCLFELGVKLGQVLWRKIFPDELEQADDHLIETCFDLLVEEKYKLASPLLQFATTTLKKHGSDGARRILIVNYAIALKYSKDASYKDILSKEDWSACQDGFRLALAVLNDQIEEAVKIMKVIGRSGKPSEYEYKTWPLFREFRRKEEFKKAFKQIFKKEFLIEEMTEKTKDVSN